MMHVDPAELRTLVAAMHQAGTTIDDIDVRSALTEDNLPGCGVFSAVREAGAFTEGAYLRMAERARHIAAIAKGNATDFELTEDEFCAGLAAVEAAR